MVVEFLKHGDLVESLRAFFICRLTAVSIFDMARLKSHFLIELDVRL